MTGNDSEHGIWRIAIDSYKSVMNTNEYREFIIKDIIKDNKKINFIGSFMVFDKPNEDMLEEYYRGTTEGETHESLKNKVVQKINKSRKKYIAFTLGSIMYTNNVCHHVSIILKKNNDDLIIKVINSGLYYLSRSYGDVIDNFMIDISRTLGKTPVFHYPYIGKMWMGLSFNQPCNPQDYCRGGLIGELSTYIFSLKGIHRESYCQTWCIMMLKFESDIMNSSSTYKIEDNYFSSWSSDKKELEIKLRNFILYLVVKYESNINFMREFKHQLFNSIYCRNYSPSTKFSTILLECFKTLYEDISIDSA
jgi:hypothetical protein